MSNYPLQRIRRVYESLVESALTAFVEPSIPVYTDNSYYAEKKTQDEFALVRLNFGQMHELTIGGMMEHIMGTLVVEVFVPKGKGPGRAQSVGEAVLYRLASLNQAMSGNPSAQLVSARTGPISGPSITPLQNGPHLQVRLSCAINARYYGTYPPPARGLITLGGRSLVTLAGQEILSL